jgi:ankyrin repeat protein
LALRHPRRPAKTTPSLLDSSVAWRFPIQSCGREGLAAFALAQFSLNGFGVEQSFERAGHWLHIAANHGFTLAKALSVKLASVWDIKLPLSTREAWLLDASKQGSRYALSQLKKENLDGYTECVHFFRTLFWARCYNIPEPWLSTLSFNGYDRNRPALESVLEASSGLRIGLHQNNLLHCAAMMGCLQAVEFLVADLRTDINTRNDRGETPLFLACRSGHAVVARYLLESGANPAIANIYHENALHWLGSFEEDEVFDIAWKLLENGAPIHGEAKKGDREIYIDNTASNFYYCWIPGTPLHRAVEIGSLTLVDTLLSLGADPIIESDSNTAVCRAARSRRADILELLLKYAPNFDVTQLRPGTSGEPKFSALHRAIQPSNAMVLHYKHSAYDDTLLARTMSTLLRRIESRSSIPGDLLGYAVLGREYVAVEQILLDGRTNIEQRENNSMKHPTPLLIAIGLEDKKIFTLLERYGADVHAEQHFGEATRISSLEMCVRYWHRETWIAKRLLDLGAEVNRSGDLTYTTTPLGYALLYNNFRLAGTFIEYGASVSMMEPKAGRGNILGEILHLQFESRTYYALEFLISHPSIKLPFITDSITGYSVFHSLCRKLEVKRKCLDPADFSAMFGLLRRAFPDDHLLNSLDAWGATALHIAIYYAFPEAVQTLLEAGADRHIAAFSQSNSTELHLRDLPSILPFSNKTPLAMVEENIFIDIPEAISIFPEELQASLERRQNISQMVSSKI